MRSPAQVSLLNRKRDASPLKTGWFVLGVFSVLTLVLGVVLLFFHHNAPVPQTKPQPAVTE